MESILAMEDINDQTYSSLMEKQKKGLATQIDKLTITKHYYKRKLGVDLLDDTIMNNFFKKDYLVDNFIYLLQPDLIPNYSDEHTEQIRLQTRIVSTLLNDLGFQSVFSQNKYDHPTFNVLLQNTIQNHFLFKQHEHGRALFGLPKKQLLFENNNNNVFKFINSILGQFCVRLERTEPVGKRKCVTNSFYSISLLHGIEEIITYKMNKDSPLRLDSFEPIITQRRYGHLLSPCGSEATQHRALALRNDSGVYL